MKKLIAALTAVLMLVPIFAVTPVGAIEVGEERVVIAADLDEAEKAQIYKDFDLEPGEITELTVTNAEEREYLEGLVDDSKIGNVALSCVYIMTLSEGQGLSIQVNNIKWCSEEMYRNALVTAGITDAYVMISAPHEVTGTAALTGIYKAYEDITGEKLPEDAKSVGAEELVITGELADQIGQVDAAELVAQLKLILSETRNMSDQEVLNEIYAIADELGVAITVQQAEKLLELCRSLEGLDDDELEARVKEVTDTIKRASEAGQFFTNVGNAVKGFFAKVGDFFSGLFGGKK